MSGAADEVRKIFGLAMASTVIDRRYKASLSHRRSQTAATGKLFRVHDERVFGSLRDDSFYFPAGMAVNAMDLRLAVLVLPSMQPTLTLYWPGFGEFSQPIGNDW
jgi:hypothetical protein